jgi:hypothetical protein
MLYSFFYEKRVMKFERERNEIPHSLSLTVNQLLFAATLFRDPSVMNGLAASNFHDRSFFILRGLYIKHLVRDEKYLRRYGSRGTRDIFSLANKSWFTVLTFIFATHGDNPQSFSIFILPMEDQADFCWICEAPPTRVLLFPFCFI